ncbi:hypothetical protein EDD11_004577 [Mortierella claussenii]|nr:hypothetical protein EDD11_004577 [Mortierella claussenii]
MFYEAQRSGKLPVDQRVKWRNDSALLDGKDIGMDLTGGYYDAGDYIKFTFPLTFTLTEICYGGLEFFDGYVLANQTHYLDQMVRWGMDYLIKAHPDNNTLYVQVAIDEIDNNYWGPDTGIPTPRPAFFVSNIRPGTDVMADAAAAFASCSILYQDKLNDTTYAATLRTHAEVLYQVAETALPQQVYQTVVPSASCCYASTGYEDELAWGAAWMYRLTGDTAFVAKATDYVSRIRSRDATMTAISWDDKLTLVYVLMAGLMQGTQEAAKWQTLAEHFADSVIHPRKPCMLTKGGMYYCYGTSGSGSAVTVANTAFGLTLLARHMEQSPALQDAAAKSKIDDYKAFSAKQVRYLLGDNPERTPYVVGIHPNSPGNPHSALAAGGKNTDTIDTIPVQEAHVLLGALVGGPDKNDRFMDMRSNWRQNEVALDYNAAFTGLIAYQVMTSHDPPPYVQIPAGRPTHGDVGSMAVWAAALIACIASVAVMGVAGLICHRRRDRIHFWVDTQKQRFPFGRSSLSTLALRNASGSASTVGSGIGDMIERKEKKVDDGDDPRNVSDLVGLDSPTLPSLLSQLSDPLGSTETLHVLVLDALTAIDISMFEPPTPVHGGPPAVPRPE